LNSAAGVQGARASCWPGMGSPHCPGHHAGWPAGLLLLRALLCALLGSLLGGFLLGHSTSSVKTRLGGGQNCLAPSRATRCLVLQKPTGSLTAERLRLVCVAASNWVARGNARFAVTPSVAITHMTAMLSLQVFYIFRVLDKSSRGNHGMTHNFARNFLRRANVRAALEIDLHVVRAELGA
jgi:hypothetical protein